MKITEAAIGWNSLTAKGRTEVEVGPYPDRTGWTSRYDGLGGGCMPICAATLGRSICTSLPGGGRIIPCGRQFALEGGKIFADGARGWMLRTKHLLADRQGTQGQWFGITQPALVSMQ